MKQKLFTTNFTLLVFGQASSLFGNIILKFALSMYVLEVTGSAAIFAGILSVSTIPTILFSPLGGILADRVSKRNIMVTLDTLTGVSVLSATLLFSKENELVVITVLLIALSILAAFETPTVQSCVPQMHTGDNIIKGNAVVNQLSAVSALVAPILGSVLYSTFGIKPVMFTSIVCFFLTAFLECFIKLEYIPFDNRKGIISIIKHDFVLSMNFMCKEQPHILKMLLLSATASFFAISPIIVGFPYIVRTVLGLSAEYYGVAESFIAVFAIIGSIASGLLIGKLKTRNLAFVLSFLGIFLIPAGAIFLLPVGVITRYLVNVIAFCGVQFVASIFNIFALSITQQKIPNHLIGKIMSYVSTITMCVQPLGQIAYGFLFDSFSSAIYLVIIPTGLISCIIGLLSISFFKKLEKSQAIH